MNPTRTSSAVALACLVSVAACDRASPRAGDDSTDHPSSPSSSIASTTGGSKPSSSTASVASAASSAAKVAALPAPPADAKPPKWLRRVSPKSMKASSYLTEEKSHSHWVPQLAVDQRHATAWQAGGGHAAGDAPWIEATFDKPVKLWGVRSDAGWINYGQLDKSARAAKVRLSLDDEGVYSQSVDKDAHAVDFLGLDRAATKVRLTYDETIAGEGDAPLAVSELSFWADASDGPSVPVDVVKKEIEAVATGDAVANAKAILLRFGVVPRGDFESATVTMGAPIVDGLRLVEARLSRAGAGTYAAFVFAAEIERDGMARLAPLDSEVLDQAGTDAVTSELTHAHDLGDDHDLVIHWDVPREDKPSLHGLRVLTFARHAVERIADFQDERLPALDADHPHDGALDIVLAKTATKPRWINRFDDRAFWYW